MTEAAAVRQRASRGMTWTLLGQWATMLLQVGGTVVLARLLDPGAFGLVAMVLAVTGFADQLRTLGLGQVLTLAESITHRQASTLFWLNIAVGAVLAVAVAALGPLLGAFYGRAEVAGIALALATVYVVESLSVQHNALLLRRLRFKSVALRGFLAKLIWVAVSIGCALAGMGYWSLVAATISASLASTTFTISAIHWVPSRPAWAPGMRPLLSFGGGVSVFYVLNYLSRNADNILIGKFLGAAPLGLYTRAYSLLMQPIQQVNRPIGAVAQPALAALRGDPAAYRDYYLTLIRGLAYIGMPATAVLAVLAEDAVTVLLGATWLEVADVFRLLAIAGILQVVAYTNGWLYATSDRAWAMARWGLVSRPVVIASFAIGLPWGITGVAASYAAVQLLLLPIGFWNATKETPVSTTDIALAMWRPFLLSVLMGALAFGVSVILAGSPSWLVLAAAGVVCGLTYAAVMVSVPGHRAAVEAAVAQMRKRGT
ncbi:MAG: lipopolysaccharide biosynthesis protein [Actinomycetota bacterium]|nr:lipopolysaccharide biosynthesis protein [Actinomycetota bacterium]